MTETDETLMAVLVEHTATMGLCGEQCGCIVVIGCDGCDWSDASHPAHLAELLATHTARVAAEAKAEERERADRLADLCSKVIAVHAEVEMDTPEDRVLHANAVTTFANMLALLQQPTAPTGGGS